MNTQTHVIMGGIGLWQTCAQTGFGWRGAGRCNELSIAVNSGNSLPPDLELSSL